MWSPENFNGWLPGNLNRIAFQHRKRQWTPYNLIGWVLSLLRCCWHSESLETVFSSLTSLSSHVWPLPLQAAKLHTSASCSSRICWPWAGAVNQTTPQIWLHKQLSTFNSLPQFYRWVTALFPSPIEVIEHTSRSPRSVVRGNDLGFLFSQYLKLEKSCYCMYLFKPLPYNHTDKTRSSTFVKCSTCLQKRCGRRFQWPNCLLHLSKVPLRHVFQTWLGGNMWHVLCNVATCCNCVFSTSQIDLMPAFLSTVVTFESIGTTLSSRISRRKSDHSAKALHKSGGHMRGSCHWRKHMHAAAMCDRAVSIARGERAWKKKSVNRSLAKGQNLIQGCCKGQGTHLNLQNHFKLGKNQENQFCRNWLSILKFRRKAFLRAITS